MKILKLMLREVSAYEDMPLRPYEASLDGRLISRLNEYTDNGRDINATSLSRISSEMLRPRGQIDSRRDRANIRGGWDNRRFMFVMVAELKKSANSSSVQYITGYTNGVDMSDLGYGKVKLGDDLELMFNSVTRINMNLSSFRGRSVWVPRIGAVDQVISGHLGDKSRLADTYSMRPMDLFTRRAGSEQLGSLLRNQNVKVSDKRGSFNSKALQLNTRDNNVASTMLSRTLNAYRAANSSTDYLDEDQDEILSGARSKVMENITGDNQLFTELAKDSRILDDGYVTWGELIDTNPDLDDVTTVLPSDPRHDYVRGQGNRWTGSNAETLAAVLVASTLPQVMVRCMYASVDFSVTNDNIGGRIQTAVALTHPFMEGIPIETYYDAFLAQVEDVIFPQISINGQFKVYLKVEADIDRDITIDIEIDNGGLERFVFPAFCDSLLAPVITGKEEDLDELSGSIVSLADELSAARRRSTGDFPDASIDTTSRLSDVLGRSNSEPAPRTGLSSPRKSY